MLYEWSMYFAVFSSDVNHWTLDTMARHHHTPYRCLLDELPSSDQDNRLQIGSVKTEGFKVPSVRYVQEATRNVISVAQLAYDIMVWLRCLSRHVATWKLRKPERSLVRANTCWTTCAFTRYIYISTQLLYVHVKFSNKLFTN